MLLIKPLRWAGRRRSPAATGQFIGKAPREGARFVMSHDHGGATNANPASQSRTSRL